MEKPVKKGRTLGPATQMLGRQTALRATAHAANLEARSTMGAPAAAICGNLGRRARHIGATTAQWLAARMPLSAEVALQPGETVVVKFVGVSYGGAVCKKAGVARP